jgi:predicted lipoprotein with Yx(FWY)xxD motif
MALRAASSLLALLLVVTGCASDESGGDDAPPSGSVTATEPTNSEAPPSSSPTQTAEPDKPRKPGTRIVLDDSDFGPMLFDANQQAIYLFDNEETDRPECYGDCAVAWPPVLTRGEPVAGRGVRSGLLGTTKRRDGSTQVTYGGHPLYFYVNEGPGQVLCHDVFLNGGYWYVVRADGTPAP